MEKDLDKLIDFIIKVERKFLNPLTRQEVRDVLMNCSNIDGKLVFDFERYLYKEGDFFVLDRENAFSDIKKYVRMLDDLVKDDPDRKLEATYLNPQKILNLLKMDDEEASIWYMEYLQKNFTSAAYSESFSLAKERGCYKGYDVRNDMVDPFIKQLLQKHLDPSNETNDFGVFDATDINNFSFYGRRNKTLTVIPHIDKKAVFFKSIEKWID